MQSDCWSVSNLFCERRSLHAEDLACSSAGVHLVTWSSRCKFIVWTARYYAHTTLGSVENITVGRLARSYQCFLRRYSESSPISVSLAFICIEAGDGGGDRSSFLWLLLLSRRLLGYSCPPTPPSSAPLMGSNPGKSMSPIKAPPPAPRKVPTPLLFLRPTCLRLLEIAVSASAVAAAATSATVSAFVVWVVVVAVGIVFEATLDGLVFAASGRMISRI